MDLWRERIRAFAFGFCVGGIVATAIMMLAGCMPAVVNAPPSGYRTCDLEYQCRVGETCAFIAVDTPAVCVGGTDYATGMWTQDRRIPLR